jgi:hypothetical protein
LGIVGFFGQTPQTIGVRVELRNIQKGFSYAGRILSASIQAAKANGGWITGNSHGQTDNLALGALEATFRQSRRRCLDDLCHRYIVMERQA